MKTVVITGASRGIGLATTRRFLSAGWKVIGTYNKNPISVDSPQLIKIQLDLSSSESIARAAAEIKKESATVDVLVNNGAIVLDNHDTAIKVDVVRKTFEVDVFGTVDLTSRLLPLMRSGSHIINIDSSYGSFSFDIDDATSAAYRMAKAALNMYTRTLAFQLKDRGIAVSSLDPGWVKTDMGNAVATETEKPDREPDEPAAEIYDLATSKVKSGLFWKSGKRRSW